MADKKKENRKKVEPIPSHSITSLNQDMELRFQSAWIAINKLETRIGKLEKGNNISLPWYKSFGVWLALFLVIIMLVGIYIFIGLQSGYHLHIGNFTL